MTPVSIEKKKLMEENKVQQHNHRRINTIYTTTKPYLGTPGGTRAGREGISGGALKGSWLLLKALMGGPGRDGIGGAPKAGEGLRGVPKDGEGFMGGPGVEPRTAGGRFGGGADDGVGLR